MLNHFVNKTNNTVTVICIACLAANGKIKPENNFLKALDGGFKKKNIVPNMARAFSLKSNPSSCFGAQSTNRVLYNVHGLN
jgi:hypothetical protein